MIANLVPSLKAKMLPDHLDMDMDNSNNTPQAASREYTRCITRKPKNRLELIYGNAIHIHGFPASHPFGDGVSSVYLQLCPLPAEATYVMGSDWRQRLLDGPVNTSSPQEKLRYIPRPAVSVLVDSVDVESEEQEHCLKMMRCGARRVQVLGSDVTLTADPWNRERVKIIMGWPAEGGVWVYRPSATLTPAAAPLDDEYLRELFEEDFDDEMKLEFLHERLEIELDMDGFCRRLKSAGAVFFERLEVCPDVVALGLLDLREGV
ncbi:hypothetical protein IFR05_003702 [Cadophora sp. M221]|nr:hypothetical protein IFR05_003702 [Cadophora sp. M221]